MKIKAGGTVNFIIAGFHLVVVYGNSKGPQDIAISVTVPPQGAAMPPLIDDASDRVYRGIDPTVLQDRVEVVHFPDPGRYLVICGVLPHFNDGMYGYVEVIP